MYASIRREKYLREIKGKIAIGLAIWATITVVLHVYTALFGTFEPKLQRSLHVLLLLPLVFIIFPSNKKHKEKPPSILDWILSIVALFPSLYIILNVDMLNQRIEQVTPITNTQLVLGTALILLVLEACRRAVSVSFAIVVATLLCLFFIAPYLPGAFEARNLGYKRIVEILYLSSHDGIYGFLTGISSNIIFVFIIFAAIMVYSGVGNFFMDLSILIAGKYRGGPAKVTVFSSGLFGSISGSSASDIYATGSFSIPLMKKIGYTPTKAGAIEAVSSAGGPLLPPVMGAGAFIMAEMTATPYTEIIKLAILGAVIYYIGVFSMVHFEAVSMGLKSARDEFKVTAKQVLIQLPYIIPFGVLLYFLFTGSSPANSAAYGLIAMLIIWLITPTNRLTLKKFLDGMKYAVSMGTVIISALTGAGIIVTVINQTGLALSIGNIITKMSGGHLLLALILIMLTTLLLGAGIPTTAAYVITATVSAAALANLGVELVVAHLFIFYFALMADITPPVGVTAFSSANLAGAPPMKTALFSIKYAFAGFIVPYFFVYQPAILIVGSNVFEVVFTFISITITVIILAAALIGAMFPKLTMIERTFLIITGLVNITPNLIISIICLTLMVGYFIFNYLKSKKGRISDLAIE